MPKTEGSRLLDNLCSVNRYDIERLYHINDFELEQVREHMDLKYLGLNQQISIHQWKRQLEKLEIRKYLCQKEVDYIERKLGPRPDLMPFLILADGILLDGSRVKEYRQRKSQAAQVHRKERARYITYVKIPFRLTTISDPNILKSFRQLLFYTRAHFDRSFHHGIWAADQRGLYARTPELRNDLKQLSSLHNKILDAIGQFRTKNAKNAWILIRRSFSSIKEAVMSVHHRQLPDLLAILLLLQQNEDTSPIHEPMARNLSLTAQKHLCQDSPVRAVFESLPELPEDPSGHLYLAYDAYCRELWRLNTGGNGIKTFWSFNQASFPRAEEGGFYDLFKGLHPEDIELQLRHVEADLGIYSTETFSLWHMVAQWFYKKERFEHMEYFLQCLCARVHDLGSGFDYTGNSQLNFDCMMSFSLLGAAQEAQGDLTIAMVSFTRAIAIRSQVFPSDMWDPGKLTAFRKLRSIAWRLQNIAQAKICTEQIDTMYASQEREDREEQQESRGQ